MSTFTQFTAEEHLVFQRATSRMAGKSLWAVVPGYRYYLGQKGSNQWVDIETGFVTDGATIPRFLWSILPPNDEYTQATTLHDKLCTTYTVTEFKNGVERQIPVDRKTIDGILKEALDVLDVTPWKKRMIMWGVNLNRLVLRPNKPKPVYDLVI